MKGRLSRRTRIILSLIAVCSVISVSWFVWDQVKMQRAQWSVSQVKFLTFGCLAYAGNHKGKFPPTLAALHPDYLDMDELFYAKGPKGSRVEMIYHPGLTTHSDPKLPLIEHPFSFEGKRAVGYVDGQVQVIAAQ